MTDLHNGADAVIPKYLLIERTIRQEIADGILKPHDRLASETELSERFNASRMTARKAVDQLVRDGLVHRRPGMGTFLTGVKIQHRLSTQISFSAAMDALGLSHSTRVLDARPTIADALVSHKLGIDPGETVVKIRRLRVVEGEAAAIHTMYLPIGYAAILEEDLRGSLTDLMRLHEAKVDEAQDLVEAAVATTEEAQLLGIEPKAPLLRITGVGRSGAGRILRYTEATYRGDRFRFSVDTSQPTALQMEFRGPAAPIA